jgi:phosphoribosyl 1,2-cyclic phosphate phosphodiesterase
MKLLFLGTAAAEGFPAIFCNCPACQEARLLGGKNIRFRSALLVNTDLLIDFGPDLLAASQRFNAPLWAVKTGLVTHAHEDHYYLDNFGNRQEAFTGKTDLPTLRLFTPPDAAAMLVKMFPDLDAVHMAVHSVKPFEEWDCSGYHFTSLKAYHAIDSLDCLFYAVAEGEHSFLYATDTGPFPAETWQALAGRSFDAIILEETLGSGKWTQHLGFDTFLDHVKRFRAEGMLKPGGRIIAHHMSHSANPTHAKLEAIFTPHGVEVAYDGMVVDL